MFGFGKDKPEAPAVIQRRADVEPQLFDTKAFYGMFTRRMAKVKDIKLRYVTGGAGEPLVLLHGWPTTWFEWWRVMPTLAEQYTVIAPDLRGFGDSERTPTGFDKATFADDIYQLVRGLGYERVRFIAHDWGVSTAFLIAQDHPEFVQKLVVMDHKIPGLHFEGEENFDTMEAGLWQLGFLGAPDVPETLFAGREREFYEFCLRAWAYQQGALDSETVGELLRTYSLPSTTRTSAGLCRALGIDNQHFDKYNGRKLKMPVYAMMGRESITKDYVHRQIGPLADDYRAAIFEETGHFVTLESPREFLAEVLPFLNG